MQRFIALIMYGNKKFVSYSENFAIIALEVVYSIVCRKSTVMRLIFAAQRNKSVNLIFYKKVSNPTKMRFTK